MSDLYDFIAYFLKLTIRKNLLSIASYCACFKVSVLGVTKMLWVNVLLNNCYHFHVYQIVVFIGNSFEMNFHESRTFLYLTTQNIPTLSINATQYITKDLNSLFEISTFETPRGSTLFTIIVSDDINKSYLKYLYSVLDILIQISPSQM